MQALTLSREGNTLSLKGDLTRHFISQKIIAQVKALNATTSVDLSSVCQVDSAGLAFLLLLIEEANKENSSLTFQHLPDDLLKLAKLSAVDTFLSVA